ncbi:uncharacterized protein STEHIDRAFT_161471 [Stereum hirsutum FP-91666 SS1]|uniref:uncharacterized protein n=1 Tax=Stereum hirsutum (strain FP-91666) TaxID=721885 RepID=UPI000444A4A6|nr:uncharacterized protein STEHIDRAFT_161471 [Stereum hirsutum FP-91666 SS1]EIM82125.1 hypothetical protein STEHIDRAFT_161471 [Stereum hirsutum FP-91666 SS1]
MLRGFSGAFEGERERSDVVACWCTQMLSGVQMPSGEYEDQILGQTVKTKWLSIGTLSATVAASYLAMSGESKPKQPASGAKQTLEQVKEAVTFKSSSSEEEDLMNSIKKYIAEAEQEAKH